MAIKIISLVIVVNNRENFSWFEKNNCINKWATDYCYYYGFSIWCCGRNSLKAGNSDLKFWIDMDVDRSLACNYYYLNSFIIDVFYFVTYTWWLLVSKNIIWVIQNCDLRKYQFVLVLDKFNFILLFRLINYL